MRHPIITRVQKLQLACVTTVRASCLWRTAGCVMSTGKEADIDGAVVEGGVGATTGGKDPTLATLGLVEGLEADLAGMLSEVRVVARSFHYAAVYTDA